MDYIENTNAPHKRGVAWEHLQKYGYLKKRFSAGVAHTAAIMYDDTLRVCGANGMYQCDANLWKNMRSVVCTSVATVGLQNNGKVVFCGFIPFKWEEVGVGGTPIAKWPSSIIDISGSLGGSDHVLGLSSDGRVYAFGGNEYGQCDVNDWHSIEKIYASLGLSIGVRKDGTVVTAGNDSDIREKVNKWSNIEHIFCGFDDNIFGLKYDGTVVTTSDELEEVSSWTGIIDICCDGEYAIGLKGNGDICFAGNFPKNYIDHKNSLKGKNKIVFVASRVGIINLFTSDGKLILDQIYNDRFVTNEFESDSCSMQFGFMNYVEIKYDGTVVAASLKETPAPIDQTQGWKVFLPEQTSEISKVNKSKFKNEGSNEIKVENPISSNETKNLSEPKKKNNAMLILGILFLFVFWPISIYFFYKYIKS